jgi:hypothetical protein
VLSLPRQRSLADLADWPPLRITQWETNKRNIPWIAFQSLVLNLPGIIPDDKMPSKFRPGNIQPP